MGVQPVWVPNVSVKEAGVKSGVESQKTGAGPIGDTRYTSQPSRKWLIPQEKQHGDRARRPQSARTQRTPRERMNSSGSVFSTGSVPSTSRSSSFAARPNPCQPQDRSFDVAATHAERKHGVWGGGQAAGAKSGTGWPKPFQKTDRHEGIEAMKTMELQRSKSCERGPKWPKTPRADESQRPKSSDKISRSAWKALPGYAGYVPQNFDSIGKTYHRTNKEALRTLRKHRNGEGVPDHPREASWLHGSGSGGYGGYSTGTEVPGYAGYFPGQIGGNLLSCSVARAAKINWRPERDGPNPPLIILSED